MSDSWSDLIVCDGVTEHDVESLLSDAGIPFQRGVQKEMIRPYYIRTRFGQGSLSAQVIQVPTSALETARALVEHHFDELERGVEAQAGGEPARETKQDEHKWMEAQRARSARRARQVWLLPLGMLVIGGIAIAWSSLGDRFGERKLEKEWVIALSRYGDVFADGEDGAFSVALTPAEEMRITRLAEEDDAATIVQFGLRPKVSVWLTRPHSNLQQWIKDFKDWADRDPAVAPPSPRRFRGRFVRLLEVGKPDLDLKDEWVRRAFCGNTKEQAPCTDEVLRELILLRVD